jgi:predicted site-specific integrase-resolvase
MTDLIGTKEACKILNIDKVTLMRWREAGKVTPAMQMPGVNGAFLFSRQDIYALAAERA